MLKIGDAENLEHVVNALTSKNLLSPDHVVNLNALIEVHLVRGDTESAVSEFLRISKAYFKMPMKRQLMEKLILEENIESIQAILDASIDIIGEQKSLYDLALNFAAMGRLPQAKKLLETPGLTFDKAKVSILYNHIELEGDLEACENFIEACKTVFGVDLDFLYHKLVNTYRSDPDKIMEIYRKIEDEGFPPSHMLLLDIAEILQNHERPVPFSVVQPEVLDDIVERACDIGEFQKAFSLVMESFEDDSTSLKCRVNCIEALINRDHVTFACKIATKLANNFADPEKIKFKKVYFQILEKLNKGRKTEFLQSLNKAFRRILLKTASKGDTGDNFAEFNKDLEAMDAFNENDFELLTKIIRENAVSNKTLIGFLNKTLETERLDEATQVAQAMLYEDNTQLITLQAKDSINNLLKKFQEVGRVDKIEQFFEEIGPQANLFFRGHIWIKATMIKRDPKAYFKMIKVEEDNPKRWMVNTEVLTEAVSLNPDIEDKMIKLADEKFVPAAVLATKLAVAQAGLVTEIFGILRLAKEEYIKGLQFDLISRLV